MSSFEAQLAIVPTVPGETIPGALVSRLEELTDHYGIREEDNRIEINFDQGWELDREWFRNVSEEFPSVRIALRGDDYEDSYTTHFLLEAGAYLRNSTETKPNLANMNLRATVAPEWVIKDSWVAYKIDARIAEHVGPGIDYNGNLNRVLKAKSASSVLLWRIEQELELTPKQKDLLVSHANYVEGFEPNLNWWLGE